MPYRSYVYQKALNILERRRSNAEFELQQRTDEAMRKIPGAMLPGLGGKICQTES